MSIPSQAALLDVALQYLESELMPTLAGEHRFKTRLAINALRIVQREALMQHQAEAPSQESAEQLAQQIRDGEVSLSDPALRQVLKQNLAQALAINNPKWLKRP
jgi:Domain of unknown function (DUF6285)